MFSGCCHKYHFNNTCNQCNALFNHSLTDMVSNMWVGSERHKRCVACYTFVSTVFSVSVCLLLNVLLLVFFRKSMLWFAFSGWSDLFFLLIALTGMCGAIMEMRGWSNSCFPSSCIPWHILLPARTVWNWALSSCSKVLWAYRMSTVPLCFACQSPSNVLYFVGVCLSLSVSVSFSTLTPHSFLVLGCQCHCIALTHRSIFCQGLTLVTEHVCSGIPEGGKISWILL